MMGPDWSLLPPELLLVVSEKVPLMADYIRFRAVCHPWRCASSPQPQHLPVQAPWLMLPYQYKGTNHDSTRLFYDLSTSKIHRLDLPETSEVEICGWSHGWLILHDHEQTTSTCLFNPITHTTISLPSYTEPCSLFNIFPEGRDWDIFLKNWEQTDDFSISKAILTASPLNPNCLVFVFIYDLWCLAFCKIGDNRWTVIEILEDLPWEWNMTDFTYSNGSLYTGNHCGHVTIYNLNSPSRRVIMNQEFGEHDMYLVEGVSGDILLIEISEQEYEDGLLVNEVEHKIYKISNNEEPDWIEVTDIGQNMLFVGSDDRMTSLLSADPQLQKWGANCLFYDSIKVVERYPDKGNVLYNHNIMLRRIDDGTVTDVTGDLGSFQMTGHWQKSFW